MFQRIHGAVCALAVLLLSGCATVKIPIYHDDRTLAASLATQDPEEVRRRFGDYSKLVGHHWVNRDGGYTTWLHLAWVVPGASMVLHHWACDRTKCNTYVDDLLQYEPKDGVLRVMRNDTVDGSFRHIRTEKVHADGSISAPIGTIRYVAETDTWRNSSILGSSTFQKMTSEEFKADFARHREQASLAFRQERERSLAFWDSVSRGLPGASQGYAEARADQQRQDARQREAIASLQQNLRARDTERPAANGSAPANATTPAQPVPEPSRSATVARSSVPDAAATRRTTSSATDARLAATPEAIFVCTKPDEKGRFECDTPVDANVRGGPNTLEQWRTPDVMVASMGAACPGARRLASTTHLVWGCGFGATNNSNSMDRSAGVDVKGRNTYYCSDKQTSCRRTSP